MTLERDGPGDVANPCETEAALDGKPKPRDGETSSKEGMTSGALELDSPFEDSTIPTSSREPEETAQNQSYARKSELRIISDERVYFEQFSRSAAKSSSSSSSSKARPKPAVATAAGDSAEQPGGQANNLIGADSEAPPPIADAEPVFLQPVEMSELELSRILDMVVADDFFAVQPADSRSLDELGLIVDELVSLGDQPKLDAPTLDDICQELEGHLEQCDVEGCMLHVNLALPSTKPPLALEPPGDDEDDDEEDDDGEEPGRKRRKHEVRGSERIKKLRLRKKKSDSDEYAVSVVDSETELEPAEPARGAKRAQRGRRPKPHQCKSTEECGRCFDRLKKYKGAGLHTLSAVFNSVVKDKEKKEIRKIFEAFTNRRLSEHSLKRLQDTNEFGSLGLDVINILSTFFGSMRTHENFVLNDPNIIARINFLLSCPRFRNDVNFHSYRFRFHLHDYATKKFLNLLLTTFCKEIGYHSSIYAMLMNDKTTTVKHLEAFVQVHDLGGNPVFADSKDLCYVKLNNVHNYMASDLAPSLSKISTFCYLSLLERIVEGSDTTKDLVRKMCNDPEHMFRLATFCRTKFCPDFLANLQRILLKFILIMIRNLICEFEMRYETNKDGKRRYPVKIEDIIASVSVMKIDILDSQLSRYMHDNKCFEKTYLTFREIKQSYNPNKHVFKR